MWQLPPINPDEIIVYLRKSRADDPLLTVAEVLAKHEQMLNDWVERFLPGRGTVPETNRYREVVSGETLESRPEVQKVLRRIESADIKAVLVVDPQRLSRGDLEDIGRLVNLLRYTGTYVFTLPYNYDLNDERDRDSFERELQRGNDFLEYQKKILFNGRSLSAQNGNFVGQRPPYGYRKVQRGEGKNKYYTLEIIPEEAEAVRLAFDLYAKGVGAPLIIERLESLGYPTKHGAKRWDDNVLRRMLQNEHYLGLIRWNYKRTVKSVKEGEVIAQRKRMQEYMLFPGKHPAIIDRETFDVVQARFGNNPKPKKNTELVNPLAGLLFCECGYVMRYNLRRPRGGDALAQPRYVCRRQKICGSASCKVSEVLDVIKDVLADAVQDFEVRAEAGPDDSAEAQRKLVAQLEQRLEKIKARELAQWDKYTREDMPKDIFDMLNKKVIEEKEDVSRALENAKKAVPEQIDYTEKAMRFRELLGMLDDPDVPIAELNRVLKTCIERIDYSRPKTPSAWGMTGADIKLDIKLKI